MLCGIGLSNDFSIEIGALNLDVFHLKNFSYDIIYFEEFFHCWNSLKTLYVVHPEGEEQPLFPPKELKKLVIYCPKSSKNCTRLDVHVASCRALKEM